jgi:cell division inhibitor SepF
MSVWSRTLIYLGLREEPDDALDWQAVEDGGAAPEVARTTTQPATPGAPVASSPRTPSDMPSNVRRLHSPLDVASDRVSVVQVRVFDDVETIGSRYRQRHAVLFDVSAASQQVARRVVDFVSGLTYASGGTLRRTASRAFLLLPDGVMVSRDERRRLAQLGYDVEDEAR